MLKLTFIKLWLTEKISCSINISSQLICQCCFSTWIQGTRWVVCQHSVFHLCVTLQSAIFLLFFLKQQTGLMRKHVFCSLSLSPLPPCFGAWQEGKDLFVCWCTWFPGTTAQAGNKASTNSGLCRIGRGNLFGGKQSVDLSSISHLATLWFDALSVLKRR